MLGAPSLIFDRRPLPQTIVNQKDHALTDFRLRDGVVARFFQLSFIFVTNQLCSQQSHTSHQGRLHHFHDLLVREISLLEIFFRKLKVMLDLMVALYLTNRALILIFRYIGSV